jgi:lysophospholipase L1-like esterase
MTSDSL